mgnify:CR=1 FL=1
MKYISHSVGQTEEIAFKLARNLKRGDCVAYRGGLGAGKTAFTRGLARGLGIEDAVMSPTFSLVNEYEGDITLYHFDMYRIENEDDLYMTGFFDYLDSDGILAIEWSENISSALPEDTIYITIEKSDKDENTREITIQGREI